MRDSRTPSPAGAKLASADRPVALPEDLEQAHDVLADCALLLERIDTPPVDLTPAAAALELAFDRLFATYRLVEDPAECVRSARAAVERFGAEIAGVDHPVLMHLGELHLAALQALESAEQRLGAAPWRPPPAPPALRASRDSLRLHAITRRNLIARVRVAPPAIADVSVTPLELPTPASFEELEAAILQLRERSAGRAAAHVLPKAPEPAPESPTDAADAGVFVPDPGSAWSPRRFAEDRAASAFEEVLLAWLQRGPIGGERWRGALGVEQRLLAGVDALVALGHDALAHLESLTLGNPTKSPAHLGALTLVLGCVEGRDALGIPHRMLLDQEASGPEWRAAFAAALALVPHPDAPRLALRFAQSPNPQHRAVGVHVLVRQHIYDQEQLGAAALDEPVVAAEALPAFALVGPPQDVHAAIEHALTRADEHVELRRAALRALTWSYHPASVRILWEHFQTQRTPDAGVLLAQYAGRNEIGALVEWVIERPTIDGVQALGWGGSLAAVPALIGVLAGRDDALKAATAEALERITGAGLTEEVEIAPERILDPEVQDPVPDEQAPLARVVGSPRDLPEDGSSDLVERTSQSPEAWRAWWRQQGSSWDVNRRYRRGYAWSPHVVWTELDRAVATPSERRLLRHELVLRASRRIDLDPGDFVKRQELALAAAEEHAAKLSVATGTFSEAIRR